jgi:hypothetical protein
VFGDHSRKLLVLAPEGSARQLRIRGDENNSLGFELSAFAEDAHGELYVMGFSRGATAGEGGRIMRIVPAGMPVGGVAAGAGGAAEDGTVAALAGVAALGGAALLVGVGMRRRTPTR